MKICQKKNEKNCQKFEYFFFEVRNGKNWKTHNFQKSYGKTGMFLKISNKIYDSQE